MQLGRDFARALAQITKERGLSQEVIASSLEAALISAYKKFQGGNQDVEVFIDTENGDISICEVKQIVDVVTSPDVQISLEDAQSQGFVDVAEGDYIRIERDPENFGRIAAQTARQVIIQRLKDAERQIIFEEFSDRVGDLVTGVVFKSENDQVLIRLNDRTEAILPREERIVSEKYIPGERMKLYLLDVRQTTRGPRIVVSRTHPGLLRKLLELEVPEIREGVIDIKNIVREAGARAKIAVQTLDVNVDPVGACVGNNGARIKSISKELCGEKVDVIVWSSDPLQYVRNALSPAKIVKIEPILEQEKAVTVYARPDQLS
ncbi:MAG: transcription termination factor NusA, partial [Synergistaceae bacterium]|nr:transcription termination factor NusA [Synergistaceae bacterium]